MAAGEAGCRNSHNKGKKRRTKRANCIYAGSLKTSGKGSTRGRRKLGKSLMAAAKQRQGAGTARRNLMKTQDTDTDTDTDSTGCKLEKEAAADTDTDTEKEKGGRKETP